MLNTKYFFVLFISLILNNYLVFSEDPGCEVVSYTTNCEIRNNRLTEVDTVIIQINNRYGEQFTNISLPYSKNRKISDLKAWIEDGSGNIIRKLKSNEIKDRSYISDYSLYEDDFIKLFTLKHNEYPYRIVYTYQTSVKQYITIQWIPIIDYKVPTRSAKFSLIVPKDFSFQKYGNCIQELKTENSGEFNRYSWEASYLKPIKNELFAPSKDEVLPCLSVVPSRFMYGVEGNSKDWASFGNWVYRLIQGLDELPDSEKTTVSELIKGITDKKEAVRILYHYMQDHTRYINVSIDIGGLKPYPASYVATNKYGDCKALTNYMKALLKAAGIPSYYTVIYGGGQPPKISDQITGPQYFNHVILTVPLSNDTIWLENTSNIEPFGYMGDFTQNRRALLVDEHNSRLIRIPGLKRDEVLVSRKIDIDFNRMGDAGVTISSLYKGKEFDLFNSFNSQVADNQKEKEIRNDLTYSNFDLISWSLKKKDRDSKEIALELNMTFYKFLKSIGDESYIDLIPMDMPNFTSPKDRRLPVAITYPIYKTDTVLVKIPSGFAVKGKPENAKINSQFGNYELSYIIQGNSVKVIRMFELYAMSYELNKYPDFYKFTTSAKEADKIKLIFRKNSI